MILNLDDSDKNKLLALADVYGTDMTKTIRRLIRADYEKCKDFHLKLKKIRDEKENS